MLACHVCRGPVDPLRDRWLAKDGHELIRCPACGVRMRAVLPDAAELTAIYSRAYFRHEGEDAVDGYADYLADSGSHRETARRRLALVGRFAPVEGRLLDVGAAAGFFVAEAIASGWKAEGIDVAEPMVRWGVAQLGVPLRVGRLESVPTHGQYAAITMWDYIEHSVDPSADIQRSRELLEPGGILAISTGDVESLVARVSGSRWHLLTPRHHNFYFGSSTLSRMLEERGFAVVSRTHPGGRYSLAHLTYKLDRMTRLPPTKLLANRTASSRLGRVAVPLTLRDIVTIIARAVP